jgi:hypothetical protein
VSVWTWVQLLGAEPRILEQTLVELVRDRQPAGGLRVPRRSADRRHAARRDRRRDADPHLFHRLHARRPGYARYFAYLGLFVWAMTTLVLGANLWMMFIGWEGVGLCSYLLIGFWFTDKAKAAAGMKAFIVNRIGDMAFICGGFALFWGLQRHGVATFDFAALRAAVPCCTKKRCSACRCRCS